MRVGGGFSTWAFGRLRDGGQLVDVPAAKDWNGYGVFVTNDDGIYKLSNTGEWNKVGTKPSIGDARPKFVVGSGM